MSARYSNSNQPNRRKAASSASAKAPTKRAPAARKPVSKTRPAVSGSRASTSRKSTASSASTTRSRSAHAAKKPQNVGIGTRIASSRAAIVAIVVVCAILVVGLFDSTANWGKAYGNVSIGGIDVGGMDAGEMNELLKGEFGQRVSHAQVTIYSDESAMLEGNRTAAQADDLNGEDALTEDYSADESDGSDNFWQVDALSLKASVPYDEVIEKALAIGRDDGGVLARLGLLVSEVDVPLEMEFDEGEIESVASEIDAAMGDPRTDATVVVEDGVARAIAGQAGSHVDRSWLKDMISRAMLKGDVPDSFVAQASDEQSRISDDQARELAAAVNQAISEGAIFSYQGRTWLASPTVLGDWLTVSIEGDEGDWSLVPSFDTALASPTIVDHVKATITSEDMAVTFEDTGEGIQVRTTGTGNIPEISSAVADLQTALFGADGTAWSSNAPGVVTIEVRESDRPETLTFEDALSLGVVTVIGECTTEFTDYAGTENRNHNIKLAADTLDGSIIEANGGRWSFNDIAGDTDEAAGYWTAGSIIDGEIVDSVGGGICQVATTIFNSVLEAGLEVNERHNHTMYMANYPIGRDAAIDYPTYVDLVWSNELASDVLLDLDYTDTSITARLYSVYTGYSSEYDIGDWEEGEKYRTLFEEDDSIGEGNYYLKTSGEDGSKISVTRYVTDDDGAAVRTDMFVSVYDPQDEVYVVGSNVDTSKLGTSSGRGASEDGQ